MRQFRVSFFFFLDRVSTNFFPGKKFSFLFLSLVFLSQSLSFFRELFTHFLSIYKACFILFLLFHSYFLSHKNWFFLSSVLLIYYFFSEILSVPEILKYQEFCRAKIVFLSGPCHWVISENFFPLISHLIIPIDFSLEANEIQGKQTRFKGSRRECLHSVTINYCLTGLPFQVFLSPYRKNYRRYQRYQEESRVANRRLKQKIRNETQGSFCDSLPNRPSCLPARCKCLT